MHGCRSRTVWIVAAALLVGVAAAGTAGAASVVVTSCSNDTDLRAKVAQLQSGTGGTVTFACGDTPPTIVLNAALGPIALARKTTIDGGLFGVTISGGNATRLFTIASGTKVTLRSLVLRNGFNTSDGGAISNSGKLTIERCILMENQSTNGSGGAILSLGKLTIRNSTLSDNKAKNGGAIYPRFPAARTIVVSSVLENNETTSTTDGWGGAILLWDGASLDVRGSFFEQNDARSGGAVYLFGSTSSLRSRANTWAGNVVSIRGGAIFNQGNVVVDGEDRFRFNSATLYGGAIANENGINVNGAWFERNDAGFGGGTIRNDGIATLRKSAVTEGLLGGSDGDGGGIYNTGLLELENVTMSGNVATRGGALANMGSSGASATLTHVTLYDNEATQFGAAIAHSYGTVRLRSSIVGGSTGSSCGKQTGSSGVIVSDGFNATEAGACDLTQPTDLPSANLQLGPLEQNGGGTPSHLPLEFSEVIDAAPVGDSIVDQRHALRPQGAAADIGAVEVCPSVKPAPFEVVVPGNRKKVVPGTLFEWNDASCATWYNLAVRQGSSTGPLLGEIKKIERSSFVLPTVGNTGQYAWRVSACNKQRCIDSPWRIFKFRLR